MDKLHLGLAVLAFAAGAAGLKALSDGRAWERRVHTSESHADTLQRSVDSLKIVAQVAEAAGAHTDTVRVTLTKLIPQTDSATHPDTTCAPSLAARDKVIAAGSAEINDLQHVVRAQINALARLTAEKDTLRATLDARPRAGIVLEALHPTLHLSLQAMIWPQARVGVGVSFDLASIRL